MITPICPICTGYIDRNDSREVTDAGVCHTGCVREATENQDNKRAFIRETWQAYTAYFWSNGDFEVGGEGMIDGYIGDNEGEYIRFVAGLPIKDRGCMRGA